MSLVHGVRANIVRLIERCFLVIESEKTKSTCDDMSDQDEELLERVKELKNKKDILEERMNYIEARRNFLENSLLNAVTVNTDNIDSPGSSMQHLKHTLSNNKKHCLKDSLTTILNWVKSNEERRERHILRSVSQDIEKTLNNAIKWSLKTNPEEEDLVLRKLLKESLSFVLNWVKDININESEKVQKQQLVDILMSAESWASRSGGNDEIMRHYLTEYLIIACNWRKNARKKNSVLQEESKDGINVGGEENENDLGELDEKEIEIAQQELLENLKVTFDWAKSIDVKPEERVMQRELLESLTMTMHWVRTGVALLEDEFMKKLLLETLMASLNWAMIVDEDEGDDLRQRLIDNLLFAINWVASYETRGNDEVMRELLRQSLSIAIEWKIIIDRQLK